MQDTRHGNSTTTQYEMYRDRKAIFINEGEKDQNVQLDPYKRPALVTAGCVVERAFSRYCVLTDNCNLAEHLR